MSSGDWQSRVHGLLARPGQVLLADNGDGWALPRVELDGDVRGDVGRALRALEDVFGARLALLRHVGRRVDSERKDYEVVWVLELLDPDWTPSPGLRWVETRALPEAFEREEHRELVLRTRDDPVPAQRAPWAREGWLAEATAWIHESLSALGRPATGRTEQVRAWSLSSVLRTPTAGGTVFFKATAGLPLFVDEGRVMRGLARMFPANVPRPLAVDRSRRWMLLDDVGPELGWGAPIDEREAALGLFGLMQVTSSGRVDELLAVGCIDRRPEWLARQIGALLADEAALAGLDVAEIARLRSLESRFRDLCRRLAEGPVPNALVHGDLHLGNVGRRDGSYLFFDWTDACVAHPFLDLIDVIWEEDSNAREALLRAYLAPWAEFATTERLLELWQVAEPLLSLNQAVSYRFIAAGIEPGSTQDLGWALPHWLRRVLGAELEALPL